VRTPAALELEPESDVTPGLGHGLVRFQVCLSGRQEHLLVRETPPRTLDKDVIEPPAPAVHADINQCRGLLEAADEKLCS